MPSSRWPTRSSRSGCGASPASPRRTPPRSPSAYSSTRATWRRPTPTWSRAGAALGRRGRPAAAGERRPPARRSRAARPTRSTSSPLPSPTPRCATRPGRRGAGCRPRPSPGWVGPTRPSRWWTRRWRSCARGARPRPWDAPCGCAASCAAKTVRRTSARPWTCCPAPGPSWSRPAPSWPSDAHQTSTTPRRCRCSSRPSTPPAGCGAAAVARDAVTALERRGAVAGRACDTPAPLTSRQRRVRELVAAGLDVNEVAQRLFLTPGTVRAVLESTPETAS